MKTMNQTQTTMWTLFEKYQPQADAKGHGDTWRRMTIERTFYAAWYASMAAGDDAASSAAWEAALAPKAATAATARYEARAIKYITQAINEAQS